MLKKILHVGIVVKDFGPAIDKFKNFGIPFKEVIEMEDLGIKIAFFPIGDSQLELIYFADPDKTRDGVVPSQKGAINHLCFEVDDLETSIQDFEKNGAKLVKGYPRPGAHGRVAFFHPETTNDVLIELCQL